MQMASAQREQNEIQKSNKALQRLDSPKTQNKCTRDQRIKHQQMLMHVCKVDFVEQQ